MAPGICGFGSLSEQLLSDPEPLRVCRWAVEVKAVGRANLTQVSTEFPPQTELQSQVRFVLFT